MKTINALFFVLIFVAGASTVSAACLPEYECPGWEACVDGIQTRECKDTACSTTPLLERRLCSTDSLDCNVKYSCSGWSSCSYMDKTDDILSNKIRFTGFQERSCLDLNECVEGFAEQKSCEDSFGVQFVKLEQCGIEYLMALDINSKREVSQINLDSWRSQRLDISFIQNNFTYCPSCYNGYQDAEEEGIDCGGMCKKCVIEHGISEQVFFIGSSWITSLLIFFAFMFNTFFDRKTKMKFLIYRAYAALERKDRDALKMYVARIKRIYKSLDDEQKADFKTDLDRLYRRI